MGLDATGYSKVTLINCDDPESCDHEQLYVNPHFPGRADGLTNGCYILSKINMHVSQSYSGYNDFRRLLTLEINKVSPHEIWDAPQNYKELPFYELINFSDCEGIIGPVTSARIYEDFKKYKEEFKKIDDSYYIDRYSEWMAVFKVAAGHGVVVFS